MPRKYSLIGDFNQQQKPSHHNDQYADILGTKQHAADSLIHILVNLVWFMRHYRQLSTCHLTILSVCPVNET